MGIRKNKETESELVAAGREGRNSTPDEIAAFAAQLKAKGQVRELGRERRAATRANREIERRLRANT